MFNVVHNRYPMTEEELLELAGIQAVYNLQGKNPGEFHGQYFRSVSCQCRERESSHPSLIPHFLLFILTPPPHTSPIHPHTLPSHISLPLTDLPSHPHHHSPLGTKWASISQSTSCLSRSPHCPRSSQRPRQLQHWRTSWPASTRRCTSGCLHPTVTRPRPLLLWTSCTTTSSAAAPNRTTGRCSFPGRWPSV